MRILALETSGQRGSVATLHGEPGAATVMGQSVLTAERRTAQSLAPAIQSILESASWSPDSIQLVAVAVGPGSFTGLRIGVTTAKTFAYAVGAEVIGVNTLRVLAQQAPPADAPLWTIMDAQRGELFAARFDTTTDSGPTETWETSILALDDWLIRLQSADRVTGPATRRVANRLPGEITIVAETHWQPTAEAVGQVGWQQYIAGQRDDVWKLLPQYYRQSAAEEKAERREQGAEGEA